MYPQSQNLGDWRTALKKARDIVHKAFPRELSPSRMLEKYASDTKKKSAAKLSTLQSASDVKNATDDAALANKIKNLEMTALPSSSPKSIPFPGGSASASAPNPTLDTAIVAGLLGVGALALYFLALRKKP